MKGELYVMELNSLTAQYFLSIQNTVEVYLNNQGLFLIQGENDDSDAFESNGSGKSTLFSEAPTWCLYGETIRGYKGDKVVNKVYKKDTMVRLEITDDNGDLYAVERYRKHKEHKNHVRLFRNGENITGKSDKDTDQMIVDLLQMDFATFTNSIMFGQGAVKMFASATDSEQKKILENMLQIDIYKACQDEAKAMLSVSEKARDQMQNRLNEILNSKKTLEDSVAYAQQQEAELADKVNARINELQEDYDANKKELEGLPSVDYLQNDLKILTGLAEKLDEHIAKFKEHEDTRNELVSDIKSLKRDMDKNRKEELGKREQLADIKDGKNVPKICEACGQDLPLEDTTHIENHLLSSIKDLGTKWLGITDELNETEALLEKVDKVLAGKAPLEEQRKELMNEISEVKSEIRVVETTENNITKTLKRITDQIEEQKNLLETSYTELIQDFINKINLAEEERSTVSEQLEKQEQYVSHLQFWVNAYGNQGIKSVLLDSVTPFLNKRAEHYLQKLTDSSIHVEFTTQTTLKSGEKRDKFSVEIINDNGEDEYKGSSNGEKRRIDVAVNMALQDLVLNRSNKRLNFMLYDEVFEGLDSIGCENVSQLLQEKAKVVGTIGVITHSDALKQLFSDSKTVRKSNGRTVLV